MTPSPALDNLRTARGFIEPGADLRRPQIMAFKAICGLLFPSNALAFQGMTAAHNGLVPGSSPGGPTNIFNALRQICGLLEGRVEPNAAMGEPRHD